MRAPVWKPIPEQKIEALWRLQAGGHVVAMVGDAAIEAAHVALMSDDWNAVAEAVRIVRSALRTIKQNLAFTAGHNVVGMLLAATVWLPPIAAAARLMEPRSSTAFRGFPQNLDRFLDDIDPDSSTREDVGKARITHADELAEINTPDWQRRQRG
ncbi:MAG TPA: hypothetical protein VIE36_09405 [Methylomirabilota bacterium]